MPTPPASSTSSPQRPSAAAGTPAEERKESPAPQVTASTPVAQAASSAPAPAPSVLKKATQQPALLADFAFLVEGLGRPPMSQAPSGRIMTEEERTIRRLEASLKQVQEDRANIVGQLGLARRQIASQRDEIALLQRQLSTRPSTSVAVTPSVRPAELDALRDRIKLVEAERASLKGRVAVLEAEHSDLTDQLLRTELEASKALGSSPEEIGSREQRLQAVMTYAMTLAQIFDRASCEYEAVLGKLILGYDRRGRVLESLFRLAWGDSADVQGRLPRAMAAVFPDLAFETEPRCPGI
ncbi:hypothetical protein ATCC90586_011700 [Pythium insidiosum]|nr:hypothetical protein ATCC90586_011700 [Pythium insidiosum]